MDQPDHFGPVPDLLGRDRRRPSLSGVSRFVGISSGVFNSVRADERRRHTLDSQEKLRKGRLDATDGCFKSGGQSSNRVGGGAADPARAEAQTGTKTWTFLRLSEEELSRAEEQSRRGARSEEVPAAPWSSWRRSTAGSFAASRRSGSWAARTALCAALRPRPASTVWPAASSPESSGSRPGKAALRRSCGGAAAAS